jgi:VIT1/CCC1 family predicted Fe2+/Mn2+ transporter
MDKNDGVFLRNGSKWFFCRNGIVLLDDTLTVKITGDIDLSGVETSETLTEQLKERISGFQRNEITEYHIYRMLAEAMADSPNALVFLNMAEQELGHSRIWQHYTGEDTTPDRIKVWFFYLMARLFGITFTVKMMEKRENDAIQNYQALSGKIVDIQTIIADEKHHEAEIIGLLNEEKLKYVGSIVLGLNDALVEFSGSLAGFTFALQDTKLIAAVGSIMGVAAALSMAASEYLSQKSDPTVREPKKAALYTGFAYILTVLALVMPFVLLENPFLALSLTLLSAIGIILCFTFYTSVTGDLPFFKRFLEMAVLSLGIAAVSFLIGLLIRSIFHVDV